MKKTILAVFALLVSLPAAAESVLLIAKGYVDVESGDLVTPAEILIDDGVIMSINSGDRPGDARVIDLGEKILLPGLMDMHVHLDLDFENASFDVVVKESGSEAALRAAKNARKTLMAGFTTIRNIGQVHPTLDLVAVAVGNATDAGWLPGPRIVAAGHMITILGGHGDLAMAEGLSEGMLELGPEYGVVSGVPDAIKATRFQIKHGAKTIKIHATAGVMSLEESVGAQQLSDEEMLAIVEEAARHDIPVAAHAHGTEGIKAAIRAGVSSIEHGSLLDDEAIEMLIENDVVLVPTNGLWGSVNRDLLDPRKRAKAEYVYPRSVESVRAAIDAGVKVALGTDAPLIPHGENIKEMYVMVERGMTNAEALRSATIIPAALIRAPQLGQIKEGYLADIIAVADDPLANIETLTDVSFVMKGGNVYKSVD